MLSEPDVGKPEERTTTVVEQCLAWGGEQRLRLQVTLSTAGASPTDPDLCNITLLPADASRISLQWQTCRGIAWSVSSGMITSGSKLQEHLQLLRAIPPLTFT